MAFDLKKGNLSISDDLCQIAFTEIESTFNQLAKRMNQVKEYHDYLEGDIDSEQLISRRKEMCLFKKGQFLRRFRRWFCACPSRVRQSIEKEQQFWPECLEINRKKQS